MPRTTPDLVKGIIEVDDGVDLTPFIATATELITDICTASGYTDTLLELIERWLSAHYYTIFDNQLAAAKAGTVSVIYQQKVDYGLRNSMYGQQVLILDYAGNLAKIENTNKSKRVIKISAKWLGSRRHLIPGLLFPDSDLTIET